ncbi:hypothetical protein D3C72_1639530 [compost metagenome]
MIGQALGSDARSNDQRAAAHLRLAAIHPGQAGLNAAFAGHDADDAGFHAQRHLGRAHAGVDIVSHLLPGHARQHRDPVVGERVVLGQAAQAGAGLN